MTSFPLHWQTLQWQLWGSGNGATWAWVGRCSLDGPLHTENTHQSSLRNPRDDAPGNKLLKTGEKKQGRRYKLKIWRKSPKNFEKTGAKMARNGILEGALVPYLKILTESQPSCIWAFFLPIFGPQRSPAANQLGQNIGIDASRMHHVVIFTGEENVVHSSPRRLLCTSIGQSPGCPHCEFQENHLNASTPESLSTWPSFLLNRWPARG